MVLALVWAARAVAGGERMSAHLTGALIGITVGQALVAWLGTRVLAGVSVVVAALPATSVAVTAACGPDVVPADHEYEP